MEKFLIVALIVSVLGGVNSLQCYSCTNCNEVNSDQLVTCGANTTSTTPIPATTTTASTTTPEPSSNTTNATPTTTVSTTTPEPSSNTTNATTTTTVSTTTPEPSSSTTNATTTTTVSTTTPEPSSNTTNATTTTTVSTTTPEPSSSTTNATTTTTVSTTTPELSSSITNAATTTTVSMTITAPTNGTTSSATIAKQLDFEIVRVRRSVDDEENCLCNNGACDCNVLHIIEFSDERATDTYVCVTDTLQVNGTTVINRGCAVKYNVTQQTCVSSAFSTDCTVCETDQCNDATSVSYSILVLLISFFVTLK